jgi:hypothetical protein
MSKAAPIISNTIRHDFSIVEVELPKNSTTFIKLYEYIGYGDFHGAAFKFSDDDVQFKMVVDGYEVTNLNISDLNKFLGNLGKHELNPSTAVYYNNSEKTLEVAFNFPIQFKSNLSFYAYASSHKDRDSEGYSVFLTKDNIQ